MKEPVPGLSGPIAWMAKNSVAANLLMLVLLIGGLIVGARVKQEVFPEFELDIVQVGVPYPAPARRRSSRASFSRSRSKSDRLMASSA